MNPPPNICSECGKQFDSEAKMNLHRKESHECIWHCDKCDKGFAYLSRFKRHMEVHEEYPKKVYQCDHCGKEFQRRTLLISHLRTHGFRCTDCTNKYFRTQVFGLINIK